MSFLKDKRVLILGLLSDRSIAYGIANAMYKQGAQLAFTHQMEKHEQRVKKLADNFNSNIVLPCWCSGVDFDINVVKYVHVCRIISTQHKHVSSNIPHTCDAFR